MWGASSARGSHQVGQALRELAARIRTPLFAPGGALQTWHQGAQTGSVPITSTSRSKGQKVLLESCPLKPERCSWTTDDGRQKLLLLPSMHLY